MPNRAVVKLPMRLPRDQIQELHAELERHAELAAEVARKRQKTEALHEQYVRAAMRARDYDPEHEALALSEGLIDWVHAFEESALRTKLQGQFGTGEMPIAFAEISLTAGSASLALRGELCVYIHPNATLDGIYHYVEFADGFIVRQGQDLKTAQDLLHQIHLQMLRPLHREVIEDAVCYRHIQKWMKAQSQRVLSDG